MVRAKAKTHGAAVEAFLEEAIVRRELSDNFCFYQPAYDSIDGAAGWARDSLRLHAPDERERLYSLEQLEAAKSHEDIWNAAQRQLATVGKAVSYTHLTLPTICSV
eukprot:4974823-Prymnesium_polylepis.1